MSHRTGVAHVKGNSTTTIHSGGALYLVRLVEIPSGVLSVPPASQSEEDATASMAADRHDYGINDHCHPLSDTINQILALWH